MTIEDLKLLVEKHHKSIIHDIEALILEYKTRPLPKTGYKYRRNINQIWICPESHLAIFGQLSNCVQM